MTDSATAAHQATGTSSLRLLRSFADTAGADTDGAGTDGAGTAGDLLGTREEAAGWLHAAGLLAAGERLTGSEHNALLRLRASLRDVLAAHAEGREDPEAAARLTRGLADGRLVVVAESATTVELATAARASYPAIVASIAVAVARAAASGTWSRLKLCSDRGCGQSFIDESPTGVISQCAASSG